MIVPVIFGFILIWNKLAKNWAKLTTILYYVADNTVPVGFPSDHNGGTCLMTFAICLDMGLAGLGVTGDLCAVSFASPRRHSV